MEIHEKARNTHDMRDANKLRMIRRAALAASVINITTVAVVVAVVWAVDAFLTSSATEVCHENGA